MRRRVKLVFVGVLASIALLVPATTSLGAVVYFWGSHSSFVFGGPVVSHNDAGTSNNQRASMYASTVTNANTYCSSCGVYAHLWNGNYASQIGIDYGIDEASYFTGGAFYYGRARCTHNQASYANCTKTRT